MICLDIDFFVFFILYSIVNLAFVFLSSNVCPFRFSNLSLTDDLVWYLFVTNRAALHHFYFIRVLLQIWVPDWASLLHRWSYKGDVSLFFDFTVGYIQISFQEFNSFICFLTDVCYMTFPLEVWCNCYATIFCWWYMFESVVMKVIVLLYRRFLLYNGKHLTFIRMELHHPLFFPKSQFVQIFSEHIVTWGHCEVDYRIILISVVIVTSRIIFIPLFIYIW